MIFQILLYLCCALPYENTKKIPKHQCPISSESGKAFGGVGSFFDMKLIPLNTVKKAKNPFAPRFAKVDDEDYDFLMQFKWHAFYKGHVWYANTKTKNGQGKLTTVSMESLLLGTKGTKKVADHKDHDGLNNQKTNLRLATIAENRRNSRPLSDRTSPYMGVSKKMCKRAYKKGNMTYFYWSADLLPETGGKPLQKLFPYTPEGEIAAAKQYDEWAIKYFGEFAWLNFPNTKNNS